MLISFDIYFYSFFSSFKGMIFKILRIILHLYIADLEYDFGERS